MKTNGNGHHPGGLSAAGRLAAYAKRHAIAIVSLALSAAGTWYANEALHVARATERRAQSNDLAASGALATLLAAKASAVAQMAAFAEVARKGVDLGLQGKGGPGQLRDALDTLTAQLLPALAPSTEEFEVVARTGDDAARALASCVTLRDRAAWEIETFRGVQGQPLPPVPNLLFPALGEDLRKTVRACERAARLLDKDAAGEPSGGEETLPPVVLRATAPAKVAQPPSAVPR